MNPRDLKAGMEVEFIGNTVGYTNASWKIGPRLFIAGMTGTVVDPNENGQAKIQLASSSDEGPLFAYAYGSELRPLAKALKSAEPFTPLTKPQGITKIRR